MDGVTGVVEHMDLRQVARYRLSIYLLSAIYYLHTISTQEETGHWDRGACPDYVDIRTEGSVVR